MPLVVCGALLCLAVGLLFVRKTKKNERAAETPTTPPRAENSSVVAKEPPADAVSAAFAAPSPEPTVDAAWTPAVAAPPPNAVRETPPGAPFATITEILAGSPAALAGLREGDLIVAFGTATAIGKVKPVVLASKGPIPVWVDRAGRREKIELTPGAGPLGCRLSPLQTILLQRSEHDARMLERIAAGRPRNMATRVSSLAVETSDDGAAAASTTPVDAATGSATSDATAGAEDDGDDQGLRQFLASRAAAPTTLLLHAFFVGGFALLVVIPIATTRCETCGRRALHHRRRRQADLHVGKSLVVRVPHEELRAPGAGVRGGGGPGRRHVNVGVRAVIPGPGRRPGRGRGRRVVRGGLERVVEAADGRERHRVGAPPQDRQRKGS